MKPTNRARRSTYRRHTWVSQMNSLILTKLGQLYRSELLAVKALTELTQRVSDRRTERMLDEALAFHKTTVESLDELLKELNFSPAEDIEVPSRVHRLVSRRDFPERLLCSWLNEFENRLREQYEKTVTLKVTYEKVLPRDVWKKLYTRSELQVKMASRINEFTMETTEIIDPAIWEN